MSSQETSLQASTAPGASRSRPMAFKRPEWLGTFLLQLLLLACLVLIWHVGSLVATKNKVVVQSPESVLNALVTLHESGLLWSNYWATVYATFLGLLISAVVGIPVGLALGVMKNVQRVVAPFLSGLNATPRIALAPVFIIVFGISLSAKVALAVSLVFFIIALNAMAGVSAADPEAVRMMTTMGASRRQILTKVVLPAAVPSIVVGLRLGLIYSLLGVIASELIASSDGLGTLIARSAGVFDLASVYAVLILLMITAVVFNMACEAIERVALRWQPPTVR